MNCSIDDKCQKEIKALAKKHKRLARDLETFVQTHRAANDPDQSEAYRLNFFNNKNAAVLSGSPTSRHKIVKARLHSSDLKDRSLRVIYLAEDQNLTLVEIYAKGQKKSEDRRRWQAYKNMSGEEAMDGPQANWRWGPPQRKAR